MAGNNGFDITHAAIAQFKRVTVENFVKWIWFREVLINQGKEAFSYVRFNILAVGWVVPKNVPWTVPPWLLRSVVWLFVTQVVIVATQQKWLQLQHFPKSNPLYKIFNRHTLKLSYSCMSNIKTIISSHNKAQINKPDAINDSNCNCRNSSTCPMDGKCNDQSIIYQAEVTTSTSKETYLGLCDTAFKLRYRNHVCSFRNERYKHATELS